MTRQNFALKKKIKSKYEILHKIKLCERIALRHDIKNVTRHENEVKCLYDKIIPDYLASRGHVYRETEKKSRVAVI